MMLEMERRTGSLEVVSGSGKRAMLALSTGLFANTELGGESRTAARGAARRALVANRSLRVPPA